MGTFDLSYVMLTTVELRNQKTGVTNIVKAEPVLQLSKY